MKRIIFDCERMKYPHTGLYHFCHQLGLALQRNADAQHQLSFYVRPEQQGLFGSAAYISQNSLQKFWLPSTRKYDIWHATYQATQYYPSGRKIKIVLTVHDLNFLYDEGKAAFKKEREIKKLQKKIDQAEHVVAISRFVLEDLRKNLSLETTQASVIYNGCNYIDIGVPLRPAVIEEGTEFLYTIGTITDKKNFHVLPALLVGNQRMLIISGIVQSQEYYDKVVIESKKHGVADRVIFTGAISENDKQWYMQHCLAFVFPSLAEGFGLPVIEAMHFGKAVVLSTRTSLPEIGGIEAYYFENFEPEHMRQQVEKALQDYISNNRKAAIIRRAEQFNWDRSAQQYLEVYNKL